MLTEVSTENKLWPQTSSTTSYATDDNSIRSDSNNNNNNAPVVVDDDDDDEKLVEEAGALVTHVSSAEESSNQSAINLSSAGRFFTGACLQDHQTTDQQLVGANWADSTGVSRAPDAAAATAIPMNGVSSVNAALPTAPVTTMARHNPQIPSSTSLIQNAAREEPEHFFEEPDTASLGAPRPSSSSTTTQPALTTTDHFSFLSSLPQITPDHQSSLHHQPVAVASIGSLRWRPDISALGATVGNSSCDALTSLTEHVDKANRQVQLTLTNSKSMAASWWYMLSRMLHNQQQYQLQPLDSPHQRQRMMSHLHHQQDNTSQSQQQMLIAVQHMSELRNELRAMDNHLFQLISYCLTQGAPLDQQQSSDMSDQSSPSQQSLLPDAQTSASSNLLDMSHQVAVAALPASAETPPASSPVHQPEQPKRTMNLKKLRLLASTYLAPDANQLLEQLPAECSEPARVSSDGYMMQVSKKRRFNDLCDTDQLPMSVAHQPPFSPVSYSGSASTLNSPLTTAHPNHQNIEKSINISSPESSHNRNSKPFPSASTKLNCMQPFHPMALAPALYYYPPDGTLDAHNSCFNPPIDRASPTDMTTTTSNIQHNLLMTTTVRDHHHHHHNSQLSLLSEVPVQTLQQRQQTMAFRCHVCGSGFEDKHRLQQHLSIHLSLDPSWFEERTIKETMVRYESKRGDYLCSVCGIRYETTAEFDKHMQLHGDKPHQCDLCNQDNKIVSFRYYRQLLTHLRSHCFLYSCRFVSECKQTANRKDYLKLHILKHHLNNKLPDQHIVCCHWKIRKTTGASSD